MFVMTMTKRRLLRFLLLALMLLTGVAIGIFAVMSALDTNAEGLKLPIYKVQRQDNKISITFDCAWGNSNTDKLINILAAENIKATFFVTGEFCDNYPEDVKKLYNAGHEIANHSDTHPHPNGMNLNDIIKDTKECSRKIKTLTGVEPALYRSPYGEYDDKVITTITGMGLKVIQWSVDSIDWDKPDKDTIISRTTKNIAPGDILLFHNDLENTEQALPEVIKSLKSQGFEPCTVSQLVYNDNYTIDSNGMQIKSSLPTSAYNTFSDNQLVNQAFLALSKSLTPDEIYQMSTKGMNPQIAAKTARLLSKEQIAAVQELSYEELKTLFSLLEAAVYARGDSAAYSADDGSDIYDDYDYSDSSDYSDNSLAPENMDKNGNPIISDSSDNSDNSETSLSPENMDKNGNPIISDTSDNSDNSDNSETSLVPENMDKNGNPIISDTSDNSDNSENSIAPENSLSPENMDKNGNPIISGDTESWDKEI